MMLRLSTLFTLLLILLQNCTAQKNIAGSTTEKLLHDRNFVFVATRAYPTSATVSRMMSQLPTNNGNQILNLTDRYTLVIEPSKMVADLPYFGIMHIPTMDRDRQGIKFTSEKFSITDYRQKKNSTTLSLRPEDTHSVSQMYLEVYENGNANLSINFIDRQPITFDGRIESIPSTSAIK